MPTYSRLKTPTPKELQQIAALYQEAGWWPDAPANPRMLSRMVAGSHCFMVARSRGDRIVGMGRAISDGASDAYIQDVAVARTHRRQGIGTALVKTILSRLRSDGMSWIGLIAERGTHGLYEPLGFKQMPDAAPMLLVLP
jgi:ribosomal protein S18 acetylase RimI-like enzyme